MKEMEILIWIISIVFITHLLNLRYNFLKTVITKSFIMILIIGLSLCANIDKMFPLYGIFISIALIFSLAGDIFLVVDGNKFFLHGLLSFVLAHLFYIISFLVFNTPIGIISVQFIVALIVICLSAGIFYSFFYKKLGKMKIPVLIYLIIIGIMASLSIRISWLVFAGAISFLVSDMELALNKFYKPIPHKSIFNSIFYFPAQFIFALSIFLLFN
ncbi:lysoplasmalogenase [Promethearchaeum syntrophicum]|uniref:Lysoplasmalogenase n=1 Tax=Promethearchaeum syntrophicum TaxID=2594042 RepID=A0A5B9DA94_9ARCH|nr:lysoplasmalogenase [Candidatus Prometheoarchaeum syntrophicum]QEE16188.1 YhhN-like protein [Candidatus Prometheoarchaeum syntrophicum]